MIPPPKRGGSLPLIWTGYTCAFSNLSPQICSPVVSLLGALHYWGNNLEVHQRTQSSSPMQGCSFWTILAYMVHKIMIIVFTHEWQETGAPLVFTYHYWAFTITRGIATGQAMQAIARALSFKGVMVRVPILLACVQVFELSHCSENLTCLEARKEKEIEKNGSCIGRTVLNGGDNMSCKPQSNITHA